ncbi:MAG: bifunctional diguanylate cyclase/phosphodiesterase [Actinomycetota bacterium]
MSAAVLEDLDVRWDATLVRRVLALRLISSASMGTVALLLSSFGPNRVWLALILLLGVPLSTLTLYAVADRQQMLVTTTMADTMWVAVAVQVVPDVYFEAALVSLAMLAFVANESHRALVGAAIATTGGLLIAGVVHEPTNWIRHLSIYVLLLPLLLFMAKEQGERDISHRLRMRFRAEHDMLTGLRNRTGLAAAMELTAVTSVIAIDLDGFKDINDTLGHEAGDELLAALASRLDEVLDGRGVLARVGGDEFTVAVTSGDPIVVSTDLLRACRRRVALGDVDVSIGASVGIADADASTDAAELLRRADLAMYEAKRSQAGVRRWTDTTRSASRARVELSGEVEGAFDEGQFVLHFQPIVDADTGAVVDVEGLLRWNHPTFGVLQPAEFLELVEGIGRRSTMDRVVFDAAARLCAELPESIGVSVNVSAGSLMRSSLPVALEASLLRHGIDAARITVEVIEDEMIDEQSTARQVVTALGAMGVGIAVDDFGTGHSSLSRLRRLPVTSLKIDRSFVAAITDSEDDRAIVRAVADLGRALDLTVVAEGVENDAVRAAMRAFGLRVDRLQGWGIAPAMPHDAVLEWIGSVELQHSTGVLP